MSDPKHPAKIVVVIENGGVSAVFANKKTDVRLFVADYDTDGSYHPLLGVDAGGDQRLLFEETIQVDSMGVRSTLNKRGNRDNPSDPK